MNVRRTLLTSILLCACGPSVVATSDDTTGSSAASVDGDDTFGGTAMSTAPDPTATTITSGDVTSVGPPDTTGESRGTSEDEGPGNFIVALDGGSSTIECDLWADDCPRGTKCMPWANDGGSSWNATKCSPLAEDPKEVGESCTVEDSGVSGVDDCGPRSMCWNVDPDTLMGECVAFCNGSEANPTCADPCTTCPISSEGVLILCLPVCDPLLQNCDDGEGCYPSSDTFICAPDSGGEMGALGESCEFINVCDPGLFCANADSVPGCEGTGCCAAFCNPLLADPCPAMPDGIECIPLFGEGEEGCVAGPVGGCLLPE